MAFSSIFLSEEHLQCCICLEIFKDPVSTPCGHNFCKACITQHWNVNNEWNCPLCKELYRTKPELRVNTFIAELVSKYTTLVKKKEEHLSLPGEVSCDVCTRTKFRAVKSCLVCKTSFCVFHLEPHQRVEHLKKHQLIDPVDNVEDRMCKTHDKPLDMFCKNDDVCVCWYCSQLDHRHHVLVPLKEEYDKKKIILEMTDVEVNTLIQERQLKIQASQNSIQHSRQEADTEIAEGLKALKIVVYYTNKLQTELVGSIKNKQKSMEHQVEGYIKELKQEIAELNKRRSELEHVLHTEDAVHLLQNFSTLYALPHTKDWSKVKVDIRPSFKGEGRRKLGQLEKVMKEEIMKQWDTAKLKRSQEDAVDVILDPETANCKLILSEDGKQVHELGVIQKVLDNPNRFSTYTCVLAKQSFSSGRFYYEVEVKGSYWIIGVVRKSINRKGVVVFNPRNGFWTLSLVNGDEYKALADTLVHLSGIVGLQKVGVFVDYEEGLVSFYDVQKKVHLYSFTNFVFTEPLYPFFHPDYNDFGKNAAPLIITAVNTD